MTVGLKPTAAVLLTHHFGRMRQWNQRLSDGTARAMGDGIQFSVGVSRQAFNNFKESSCIVV
jgi:hypothetical protein